MCLLRPRGGPGAVGPVNPTRVWRRFYVPSSIVWSEAPSWNRHRSPGQSRAERAQPPPERKAGKISSQAFFDVWNQGDDSFGNVNPNAALVCMRDSEVIEHVVTLSRPDYSAENDDVTYDIQYVDSTGPADTETCTSEVSLFIDSLHFYNQNQLIHFQ